MQKKYILRTLERFWVTILYIKSTLFAKLIFQTRTSISLCEILKFKTTYHLCAIFRLKIYHWVDILFNILGMRVVPSELGNQCLKSAILEKFKHFLSIKLYSDHILRHSQQWINFHTDRMASETPNGPYFGLILNPKRNTDVSVTKA